MLFAPPQTPEEIAAEALEARERREREIAERRPIVIGLLGTLIIHLLLGLGFWQYPQFFPTPGPSAEEIAEQKRNAEEMLINLTPDEPEQRQPFKFVETNPDAPENDPGKTDNYGARNQQAAQPVPGKDHSDRGQTKGELEQSTAIVTGSRAEPVQAPPPGAGGQNQPQMTATATGPHVKTQAETPLPGFEKVIGDNPDGIGTNIGESPKDAKVETEKAVAGEKDAKPRPEVAVSGGATAGGMAGAPGRPGPRPRPKLQNVRPAPLANQPLAASNTGVIGVDSRLSAAGVWWQEFIETVDAQWQKIVMNMTSAPPPHSKVMVKFTVNAKGEIRLIDVQGENVAGKAATLACTDAIQAPAPYRPWTPDMIAMFAEEEEVYFTFYYW